MSLNLRKRLHVVKLEDRCNPSLFVGYDVQQNLNVTAAAGEQTDNLTIRANSGNTVTVMEGAQDHGTYALKHDLNINLGDNTIGFLLNRIDLNGSTMKANVSIQMGATLAGAFDQFQLTTPEGTAGTLIGNLSVRCGDGAQFFRFGGSGNPTAVRTVNVTGSVDVDMGGGGSFAGFPDIVVTGGNLKATNAELNVGGRVTVSNSNVVALRGSVGSNLSINSSAVNTGSVIIVGNFGLPIHVQGRLTIATGEGDDLIQFQTSTISGNAKVDSGAGTDEIDFGFSDDDGDNPATFLGNLQVRGGAGDHLVNFGAENATPGNPTIPCYVRGNLDLDLDGGNDVVEFTDATSSGHYIGVRTGSGDDVVSISKLMAPNAAFVGLLGQGNDVLAFANNATVQLGLAIVDGGPGSDVLDMGLGNSFAFPMIAFNF